MLDKSLLRSVWISLILVNLLLIIYLITHIPGTFDWGSLIGGLIGGVLTLAGVKLTLDKQERDRLADSLPETILKMDGIGDTVRIIDECLTNDDVIRVKEGLELLASSSLYVNASFYQRMNDLKDKLYPYVSSMSRYQQSLKNEDFYKTIFLRDTAQYEKMKALNEIKNCRQFINDSKKEIENKFFNITK